MSTTAQRVMIALALMAVAPAGHADFRAVAVMSSGQGGDVRAELFVAEGRLRKEYDYYGEPVVEILDTARERSLMCFRTQRTCFEHHSLQTLSVGSERPFAANPCDGTPDFECARLDIEEIDGRAAVKWRVTSAHGDQRAVSHHWIDAESNLPLRRELPDGVVVELDHVGEDLVNDRPTDKWQVTVSRPDGHSDRFLQWFDRELGIAIRQEFANGATQELRSIVVGEVPDELFAAPPGFVTEVAPGKRQQSGMR